MRYVLERRRLEAEVSAHVIGLRVCMLCRSAIAISNLTNGLLDGCVLAGPRAPHARAGGQAQPAAAAVEGARSCRMTWICGAADRAFVSCLVNGVYRRHLVTLCCPVLRTQVRETVTRVQKARAGEAFHSYAPEMDLMGVRNFGYAGGG